MAKARTASRDAPRPAARDRILAAARELFGRDGYDATTMQQIVAAAGTSIGNAYFYFPNKEGLLVELIEAATVRSWDEADAAAGEIPAGPARIGAIIYWNMTSLLGPYRDVAELMLHTDQRVAGVAVLREISMTRWRPHLTASFPEREPMELELAAAAIFGANRAVVERAISERWDARPAELARRLVHWSLRALGASAAEIETALRRAARGTVNR